MRKTKHKFANFKQLVDKMNQEDQKQKLSSQRIADAEEQQIIQLLNSIKNNDSHVCGDLNGRYCNACDEEGFTITQIAPTIH